MTQQEKAREVLDGLLRQGHYNRCGVSEKFLRKYAAGKWVDKDVRLDPDALVDEAEARVSAGKMICFFKGHNRTLIYKPAKGQKKRTAGINFGERLPTVLNHQTRKGLDVLLYHAPCRFSTDKEEN